MQSRSRQKTRRVPIAVFFRSAREKRALVAFFAHDDDAQKPQHAKSAAWRLVTASEQSVDLKWRRPQTKRDAPITSTRIHHRRQRRRRRGLSQKHARARLKLLEMRARFAAGRHTTRRRCVRVCRRYSALVHSHESGGGGDGDNDDDEGNACRRARASRRHACRRDERSLARAPIDGGGALLQSSRAQRENTRRVIAPFCRR